MRRIRSIVVTSTVALAVFAAACTPIAPSDGAPGPPQPAADAFPNFAISDVNPASARFGEEISPRDYLGEVSAWYFGHST